jgi:hypothetical protein
MFNVEIKCITLCTIFFDFNIIVPEHLYVIQTWYTCALSSDDGVFGGPWYYYKVRALECILYVVLHYIQYML